MFPCQCPTQWLARHPVSRDPPFRKGSAGLRLSWKDVPRPSTIFRSAEHAEAEFGGCARTSHSLQAKIGRNC
eukprot:1161817-Pelagomonas_calceolata.AAC.6